MTRRFGLPFQGKRSSYWATEGAALGYDGTAFQAGLSTSCPANNPAQRFEGSQDNTWERRLVVRALVIPAQKCAGSRKLPEKLETLQEPRRKILRPGLGPFIDQIQRKETSCFDLRVREQERAVVPGDIEFHEFESGVFAGADGAQLLHGRGDTEFFLQFALGGFSVILAGVHVARGAGIPL